jgi:hypothetical protein
MQTLPLAFYMLAYRWSVHNRLREAGATEETLRDAWNEAAARLVGLLGEQKAEQAARLTYEFNLAATGQ